MNTLVTELRSSDPQLQKTLSNCRHRMLRHSNVRSKHSEGVKVLEPRNEFDIDYRCVCLGLERFVRSGKGKAITVSIGELARFGSVSIYLPVVAPELRDSIDLLHESLRQQGVSVGALECSTPSIVLADGLSSEGFVAAWEDCDAERFPSEAHLDLLTIRTDAGTDLYTIPLQP